jgi:hypothetical protein
MKRNGMKIVKNDKYKNMNLGLYDEESDRKY